MWLRIRILNMKMYRRCLWRSDGDTQYQSQSQILCWIIFSRSQWIVKLIYFAPITH